MTVQTKIVVVLDNGTGVGLEAAQQCSQRGEYVVFATMADEDVAKAELPAEQVHRVELQDPAEIERLFSSVAEAHGKIDVLIHAAYAQASDNAEALSLAEWQRLVDINLTARFLAAKHAVPLLRNAGKGAIVQLSSIQGTATTKDNVTGATFSGAIEGLTRAMANDYASDAIRVNNVRIGATRTRFLASEVSAHHRDGAEQFLCDAVPMRRPAEAAEVAKAILFLASSDASYITGASLTVDGGLTIKRWKVRDAERFRSADCYVGDWREHKWQPRPDTPPVPWFSGQRVPRLAGKVAVITGGSSGIGRSSAILFAREGASVVIADWQELAGRETQELITREGGRACFVLTDVSNPEHCERLMSQTVAEYGGIDILFSNAGINMGGDAVRLRLDQWQAIVGVDLTGEFLCAKAAIPWMRRRGGGAIINMSSPHGLRTDTNTIAYATSKSGIISMTRAMALDHAEDGIRVNCLLPGSIDTPLVWTAYPPEDRDLHMRRFADIEPLGHMGHPEVVAQAALYLASSESSFVTGAPLIVDGGVMANLY